MITPTSILTTDHLSHEALRAESASAVLFTARQLEAEKEKKKELKAELAHSRSLTMDLLYSQSETVA